MLCPSIAGCNVVSNQKWCYNVSTVELMILSPSIAGYNECLKAFMVTDEWWVSQADGGFSSAVFTFFVGDDVSDESVGVNIINWWWNSDSTKYTIEVNNRLTCFFSIQRRYFFFRKQNMSVSLYKTDNEITK